MYTSISITAAVTALATLSSAMPATKQNWEMTTNALGYSVPAFREGMQPGSDDYTHRYGDLSHNTTRLTARDDSRYTKPYVGNTEIPYGCNTDIGNYVLSKLYDICGDDRCDGGTGASIDVEYPNHGEKQGATVTFTADGQYPSGQKDSMIKAIQALVPKKGVRYYDVVSQTQQVGPYLLPKYAKCEVVGASNFMSIVVRNSDDDGLVGKLDVSLTFTQGNNSPFCGTIATVAKEIAGAINGIAGGLFGIVQAVSCAD